MKNFKLAVIGRSNAGKSTLVSVLLSDKSLGNSLYEGNEKGKTKLNTEYYLHTDVLETSFQIKQNENLVNYYIEKDSAEPSSEEDSKNFNKLHKKLKNNLASLIPDINFIPEDINLEELCNRVNHLVKIYLDKLNSCPLEQLLSLSEEKPILRDLIELVTVHTKASPIAETLIKKNSCETISIIDTKGFGDTSDLINYEFPKVDAVIFMISDKYIQSDYKAMEEAIQDQINKIPTIICARGQKLRIEEMGEIIESDNSISALEDYSDTFSQENSPACILKNHLYQNNILKERDNAHKSIMELYLHKDDIFRTIPCILNQGEKSGKQIVTPEVAQSSKNFYDEVVADIINKAMEAKIKEDTAVERLIEKLSGNVKTTISQSMLSKCHNYIMEACICVGLNTSDSQRTYFGKTVQSIEKFTSTIHRYIHGPRGGTTGYYAYNYDRLAISSYVCLEKGFENMFREGIDSLDFAELELITRKVRRDICKYGKLAGVSENYIAYIDYSRLCKAYDVEKNGNKTENPWNGNFENYNYAYPVVRDAIDNNNNVYNKSIEFKHAASIYYGVIRRTVADAINDVLGAMPNEISDFVQG
jgi:GTPase SAR1 family protein